MISEITDWFTRFIYDPREGIWGRYKRFHLARYNIPITDMGLNGTTDANGNLSLIVYQNQESRDLVISRLYILADGYTPASPYLGGSNTWGGIFPDKNASPALCRIFIPATPQGQVFPNVATFGEHSAPRFKSGEDVVFYLTNGPANTNVTVRVDGWLKPAGTNEDTY